MKITQIWTWPWRTVVNSAVHEKLIFIAVRNFYWQQTWTKAEKFGFLRFQIALFVHNSLSREGCVEIGVRKHPQRYFRFVSTSHINIMGVRQKLRDMKQNKIWTIYFAKSAYFTQSVTGRHWCWFSNWLRFVSFEDTDLSKCAFESSWSQLLKNLIFVAVRNFWRQQMLLF